METTHITPITTEDHITAVARGAADAKRAKRVAEEGWKSAEAVTIDAFDAAGITTVVVPENDGTVTRITVEGLGETRQSIDFDALAELLPANVLAEITTTVTIIDPEKYAAAIAMGVITPKVAEMVTTVKAVKPSIRVTFKAKNVKV